MIRIKDRLEAVNMHYGLEVLKDDESLEVREAVKRVLVTLKK